MEFETNRQHYLLDFIPARWFLFKPTRSGVEVIPVVDDEAPLLSLEEIEVTPDTEVVN